MGKTKVVLDTNILVSALGWEGKPREIFRRCLTEELELIVSHHTIAELQNVMDYPRFCFTKEQKQRFLSLLLEKAVMVEIPGNLKFIQEDPDDDIFLETALAGNADYIVSGDRHLLTLGNFGRVKIVNAAEFLEFEK